MNTINKVQKTDTHTRVQTDTQEMYRCCARCAVGQEPAEPFISGSFERHLVGFGGRGLLDLHKVLVVPAQHAVLLEPLHHLVPQSLVAPRAGLVVVAGKLTAVARKTS